MSVKQQLAREGVTARICSARTIGDLAETRKGSLGVQRAFCGVGRSTRCRSQND